MQLFWGGLGLCPLRLAPLAPCPAPIPAQWWKGALIFSKVGGLSFGLSLWDMRVCLRVPRAWHACECVRVNSFGFRWFRCQLQCSVGLWYLTLWILMYFLDILIKFFNSSTCLLTPPFLHTLSKDSMSSYCVLCMMLGAGKRVGKWIDMAPGRWSEKPSQRRWMESKGGVALISPGREKRKRFLGRGKSKGKNPLAEGNMVHLGNSKESIEWSGVIEVE